jgi:hypothetical protein
MTMTRSHLTHRLVAVAAVGGLALLAACGNDESDARVASSPASSVLATSPATTAPATTEPATTETVPAETVPVETGAPPGPIGVTAEDFRFVGLPDEVAAGTQFQFANASAAELHELVVVRLPDEDQRPVTEIVTNDLGALFAAPPSFVLLAAPGGEQITAVGDGTLTEPGRYAVVCMIPTGIDPMVYLNAAAESGDGPPQVEGGGAPHVFNGMFGEFTVTPAG